jgi:hypothetical protein
MPIFDPRERSGPMLPAMIVANIFPLVGIIYYDVNFFALFYLYWWETVIISIFRWQKMGWASKPSEPDPTVTYNGQPLTNEQVNNRRGMRIRYFFVRSGMMLFYLLFIVVFVGILTSIKEDAVGFASAITFSDPWVFWSFVGFVIVHLLEYISWIRNETYKETTIVELSSPFDSRIIVMHVVIVGGTFLAMFTSEKLFPDHPHAASIGYGALFVFLKTIIDVIAWRNNHSRQDALVKVSGALRRKNSSTN